METVNGNGFEDRWLSGWKDIALYLGRSVTTVKRYHSDFKMPIRYGPYDSIFAKPSEIDKWLSKFNNRKK